MLPRMMEVEKLLFLYYFCADGGAGGLQVVQEAK
jgi:hypothetical protein